MNQHQLPIIKYTLNGTNDIIDPNEDVWINGEDLFNECSLQGSKFAFYGSLYVDFSSTLAQLKNELKKYEAENEALMREKIIVRYGDKERITEAKLEAEYLRDPGYQNLQVMILDTEKKVNLLEVIKEAFKQRSQQLYNMTSLRKQESINTYTSNE